MMETLLNNGAELAAVDADNETSLDCAKKAERLKNMEYLLPLLRLK